MTVSDALRKRRAARSFDPSKAIPREVLDEVLEDARWAPSALNLQPVSLVVCREANTKRALRAAAFDQQKIEDAAVVVAVIADLNIVDRTERFPALNCFEPNQAEEWYRLASLAYRNSPQRCREEAFRSGGLTAMALLVSAESHGLASAPVGGFDEQKVSETLGLPPNRIPVLLVALGFPGEKGPVSPRPPRTPASEFLQSELWSRRD